jgi:glycosyltransferase involved in cell wall biosynthesis
VILRGHEIRADRLAAVIGDIIGEPGRMRAMSEGALRVAEEHLNWDRLVERTLRFNDALPVTATPSGLEWGSEIRTR